MLNGSGKSYDDEVRRHHIPHQSCFRGDPCEEGAPESCPAVAAEERRERARHDGAWAELVLKQEAGGLRHYLDGQPVHCGEGIELQKIAYKSDDYGEYSVFLQEAIPVRYEATRSGSELQVTIYTGLGGHEFATGGEPWMRFRWRRR